MAAMGPSKLAALVNDTSASRGIMEEDQDLLTRFLEGSLTIESLGTLLQRAQQAAENYLIPDIPSLVRPEALPKVAEQNLQLAASLRDLLASSDDESKEPKAKRTKYSLETSFDLRALLKESAAVLELARGMDRQQLTKLADLVEATTFLACAPGIARYGWSMVPAQGGGAPLPTAATAATATTAATTADAPPCSHLPFDLANALLPRPPLAVFAASPAATRRRRGRPQTPPSMR